MVQIKKSLGLRSHKYHHSLVGKRPFVLLMQWLTCSHLPAGCYNHHRNLKWPQEGKTRGLHPAQERHTIWQDIGPPRPHRHSGPMTPDDHQQPPKGASAHLDLRSSCDLHVLPQCGNALVSFLPAHTLDTIKAAEMKSLDFYGKVFIGHNKYIHTVIFESTLFSLSSLHFAYFIRHKKNSSWPKREVFKKKTWREKKQLREHFIQTSSWNFIWKLILENITHNQLKNFKVTGNFYYQSKCLDQNFLFWLYGHILHWQMLFFPQPLWISWWTKLFQDFRNWMTFWFIIILWKMPVCEKSSELCNFSSDFFPFGPNN